MKQKMITNSMLGGARTLLTLLVCLLVISNGPIANAQKKLVDAKNKRTGKPEPEKDPHFEQFAIYSKTAPRPKRVENAITKLPLNFNKGQRIAFIGNTLLERAQYFGYIETALHQQNPSKELVFRNFSWSADTSDIQPRPDNFADLEQHLTYEKIDVIIASFGFNESFAGPSGLSAFKQSLSSYIEKLQSSAFNGQHGPQIILLSPIANENIAGVPAADLNNSNIKLYTEAIEQVAKQRSVGFIDVFNPTQKAMENVQADLTFNGIHMIEAGYELLGRVTARALTGKVIGDFDQFIRNEVVDKNRQYFRRYRPLNTYYYTGARNKSYGYLDFLPAMKNFQIITRNHDKRIWELAQGGDVSKISINQDVEEMPMTSQSRGANKWLSPEEELKAFKVDPAFEVNLFASEVEFPDIACPIQMRWDTRGRMWVSCSTTYPHVYPGNEPNDKIVILEDTDHDGKADKSTVFADDLQIPLSFELGDGGVYISEEPHLIFLKDTDGDDKADFKRILFTGFGCEDSHHALHDFVWTPEGDLLFRESIFHNSQVETPYGPVRAKNSAWFQLHPKSHRLTSFGSYPNTNPWGVTFDKWGYHVASHPIFAAAFHATNPPFPTQHPRAAGIPAYSGVCGHEFVDFDFWPKEMQGGFVKVRYKPTNRVEFHTWNQNEDSFFEKYQKDLIFSTNLSFIPTDLKYGPRGAMYVIDWYNPIKGHMQYSLRDERRDRKSGRIWRIIPKGASLPDAPKIYNQPISNLLNTLKRPEYRIRYMAKMELRERPEKDVIRALDQWVNHLDSKHPNIDNHRLEALWMYKATNGFNESLWGVLLNTDNEHARAGAVRLLRSWHLKISDTKRNAILKKSAQDSSAFVRMEAAIAASYIGDQSALDAIIPILSSKMGTHLKYAVTCALGSEAMRAHWMNKQGYEVVHQFFKKSKAKDEFAEPNPSAKESQFDLNKDLKVIDISCVPERMRFTKERISAKPGQPIKLVFTNPDATDHNLVLVQPGAVERVGTAANKMAKDPKNMASDFVPQSMKQYIIAATKMVGPNRKSKVSVLRFNAPTEPGRYPYICTFPGHWVIMKGTLIVQ